MTTYYIMVQYEVNAMNNVLTPAEKYERQKELARLVRQKRFYEKNSETIKQKKKSDRMELKQLRTEMVNTQINPPIVPAPAPKRNALDDLAQYASDEYIYIYIYYTYKIYTHINVYTYIHTHIII